MPTEKVCFQTQSRQTFYSFRYDSEPQSDFRNLCLASIHASTMNPTSRHQLTVRLMS